MASRFGSFGWSGRCAGMSCGPGGSVVNPGPVSFTVADAAGVNVSNFIGNDGGFFFASDVLGVTAKTGDVAAGPGTVTPPPPPASTPEPSSLLLFGTGLAAAAGLARRRVVSAVKSN